MKILRAVVTGGATNIGRAITENFLAQGGRVVVGQPDPAVAAPLVERYGDRVIALKVDVGDLTPADFSRLVAVNLGGVVFCSQAAVPHLRAAGGGVIIHISSINALRPQRGAMIYAATKAAVSSLAQSMGKELAADRIRVVAVAPGDIRTDSSAKQLAEMADRGVGSDVVNQTPLGTGVPADIAGTVAFLCSDHARFVTGTTWVVDGGLLA
jgi:glucose 1-dehydrogenase